MYHKISPIITKLLVEALVIMALALLAIITIAVLIPGVLSLTTLLFWALLVCAILITFVVVSSGDHHHDSSTAQLGTPLSVAVTLAALVPIVIATRGFSLLIQIVLIISIATLIFMIVRQR